MSFAIYFFAARNQLHLLLLLLCFLFVDLFLMIIAKIRIETRMLFYLVLFFIIQNVVSAMPDSAKSIKSVLHYAEIPLLVGVLCVSIFKNKVAFSKTTIAITSVLCVLVVVNLASVMSLYGSKSIFVTSTLSYCKYFLLIYFAINSKLTQKDITTILKLLSPIVLFGTFLAILQFAGVESFFEPFRGNYSIMIRNGAYRAIGYLPYPIEFANHALVLFCLYYFSNKYHKKNKLFLLISGCLLLDIFLTGTRVAIVTVLLVLFLDSLRKLKSALRFLVAVTVLFFLVSALIDLNGLIEFTKEEYSSFMTSPRVYYTLKGLEVWQTYPMLGVGFDTFGSTFYGNLTGNMIASKFDVTMYSDVLATTDTFVAKILPEFGLVGVAAVLALIAIVISRYKFVRSRDISNRVYMLVILSCLLLSLNSANVLFNSHVGAFMWLSIGMILSNSRLQYVSEPQTI